MKNLLWLCALAALSACTVTTQTPQRVILKPDGSVTVDSGSARPKGGAHRDGTFCPPGQEKKGRCRR